MGPKILIATTAAVIVLITAYMAYATWNAAMYNEAAVGMMGGPIGSMPMGGVAGSGIGYSANWWGAPIGMMGGRPMIGWQGNAAYVNDSNIVEYVEQRTGYNVISVEKYSNGYYVIIGADDKPLYEILVFPNGFIHPEPQSVMWHGAPMRITEEEAESIAENWLARYFPGSKIEEVYVFPGYYTFHFEINGDMQMLSVNGYDGAVWYHGWHGKYLGEVALGHHS